MDAKEAKKLMQDRRRYFDDAMRGKEPDRVPLMSSVNTWRIFDGGKTLSEALTNYDVMGELVTSCHEKYPFDGYTDFGNRNPIRITDAMGSSLYVIDDEAGSLNYLDKDPMPEEDYPLFIENMSKYLFERFIPGRFRLKNRRDALKRLRNAAKEMLDYQEYCKNIQDTMAEEYGALFRTTVRYNAPIEFMFNYIRGFKGIAIDMRRNKEQLKASLDMLDESLHSSFVEKMDTVDVSRFYSDTCTTLLAHASMSPKQFEEFYWPYLKSAMEEVIRRDKTMWIFVEECLSRFLPFFMDLPDGAIAFHLDHEDIYDIKQKVGDKYCLSGGFPTNLLANGTPEECEAYAKQLIDDFAPGGKFIFGIDKMLSFKNDARPETLHAVVDTVLTYKVK